MLANRSKNSFHSKWNERARGTATFCYQQFTVLMRKPWLRRFPHDNSFPTNSSIFGAPSNVIESRRSFWKFIFTCISINDTGTFITSVSWFNMLFVQLDKRHRDINTETEWEHVEIDLNYNTTISLVGWMQVEKTRALLQLVSPKLGRFLACVRRKSFTFFCLFSVGWYRKKTLCSG